MVVFTCLIVFYLIWYRCGSFVSAIKLNWMEQTAVARCWSIFSVSQTSNSNTQTSKESPLISVSQFHLHGSTLKVWKLTSDIKATSLFRFKGRTTGNGNLFLLSSSMREWKVQQPCSPEGDTESRVWFLLSPDSHCASEPLQLRQQTS